MLNRATTVRQAVIRALQYSTITVATVTLLACSSYEMKGGRDKTGMTTGGATTVSVPEGSLPMCNAPDNRAPPNQEESACTAADNSQNTIVIKVATTDDAERQVKFGQTFFCQCGAAKLRPLEEGETIAGTLRKLQSIAIISLNPTCIEWSEVGGLHCVTYL